MVARVRPSGPRTVSVVRTQSTALKPTRVVTYEDESGRILFREACVDGVEACSAICRAAAHRNVVMVGDVIRVTAPPPDGEVHNNPRETD
jgi:hypothetical protein